MKHPLTAKQIVIRALENVQVFGNDEQKKEAEFLKEVIESATAHPRAVNFARRKPQPVNGHGKERQQ